MKSDISIYLVKEWDRQALIELYTAGGWWHKDQDPEHIPELVRSSFAFAIAFHNPSGRTIGMGRAISDGVSDAYLQDLVILPEFRGMGAGRKIVEELLRFCISRNITWIALIAEPGTDDFYGHLGFFPMRDHIPMKFRGKQ
ncbi:MAG: GNAT family N-acetyltransferase [Methanoregulaceae archaeon]|nr:GNAT family N-acetyltransferase [Methanoregulaceae archaeon]